MRHAKRLQSVIDSTIAGMLGGELIGSAEVADVVLGEHRGLIHFLAKDLAQKHVRRMVCDAMKKVSALGDPAEQSTLFGHLKGLPQALSVEVGGDVKYIARSRARRAHWMAHLAYLSRLIDADVSRRRAVARANDILERLRSQFGDLTEDELMVKARGLVEGSRERST